MATKPTGWADWASISTAHAVLQDGTVAKSGLDAGITLRLD
jgi:hypothetical protein